MPLKTVTISSIFDLIEWLKSNVSHEEITWFRGHQHLSWKLLPALMRRRNGIDSEMALIKRFKQNALSHMNRPFDEWAWLFAMQHYGAPTRLLDWTENPLVGIYFAVEVNAKHDRNDGALWMLYPNKLNELSKVSLRNKNDIIGFGDDPYLEDYLPSKVEREWYRKFLPVAAIAKREYPRMVAQAAVFTISHRDRKSIEDLGDGSQCVRFRIPRHAKIKIREDLVYLGISRLSLFPELQNVAEKAKEVLG